MRRRRIVSTVEKRRRSNGGVFRLGVALAGVLLAGCSAPWKPTPVRLCGQTMGTVYAITIDRVQLDEAQVKQLQGEIDAALAQLNRQMSTYDPESELSRFNAQRDTEPFPVSKETAFVVSKSLEIFRESDGYFDVTVGPLVNLWGFGPDGRRRSPPESEEIERRRSAVGSNHLAVQHDPPALVKSIPDLQVDLSAIAKGYGVDLVSSLLKSKGYGDHLVEIGGEVVGSGRVWRIGVERPAESLNRREIEEIVLLENRAMATSGGYRNFFDADGKRYSHTIDPKTGRPVEHSLASVTVVAKTCAEADAIATAVMAMGPTKGLAWLESLPEIEGLLLIADGPGEFKEAVTSGMQRLLQPK